VGSGSGCTLCDAPLCTRSEPHCTPNLNSRTLSESSHINENDKFFFRVENYSKSIYGIVLLAPMKLYCVKASAHDLWMLVDALGLVHAGRGAWSLGCVDKHELDERVRGCGYGWGMCPSLLAILGNAQ
jgi:hypothetical protein